MKNNIAVTIDASEEKARYDHICKLILANREIIAPIMKSCLPEYEACEISDIITKYIEGTPEVGTIPVMPDETNPVLNATGSEDITVTEGTVVYDVRFNAILPDTADPVGIIINIEAQNQFHPGYPLIKRAIYYCSRLISSQHDTVFSKSEYNKIQKVCSIWICMSPIKEWENTITRYRITEENIYGEAKEKVSNYDLMSVVMLCLENNDDNGENVKNDNRPVILKLLSLLFSESLNKELKKKRLTDEFAISMTKEMEDEVDDMCNLSSGIEERGLKRGITQGIEKGKVKVLYDLVKDGILTIAEAAKRAGMSEEKFRKITML